jgi:hypothetical protein
MSVLAKRVILATCCLVGALALVGVGGADQNLHTARKVHIGRTQDVSGHACTLGAPVPAIEESLTGLGLHVERTPSVLGCGRRLTVLFWFAGYVADGSVCVVAYFPDDGSFQGGACKPEHGPWSKYCPTLCTRVEGGTGLRKANGESSLITGVISPVPRTIVILRHEGGRVRKIAPVVLHVQGAALKRLGQVEAFSVFGTLVSGCASSSEVDVEVVGPSERGPKTVRGSKRGPNGCVGESSRSVTSSIRQLTGP